ncbi:hypothetical protein [Rhizobium lentis]|uniref:hypothetical protein n=1 Tax=Rhizobium lentis TaxID=1138194 RepID=UPI00287F5F25|nr:hypothetical protein [Rhizobium lentis]
MEDNDRPGVQVAALQNMHLVLVNLVNRSDPGAKYLLLQHDPTNARGWFSVPRGLWLNSTNLFYAQRACGKPL